MATTVNNEEVAYLTLEHLKAIRKTGERTEEAIQDIKLRMSSLERSTALLHLEAIRDERDPPVRSRIT